ncbi:DUF4954 family protein [Parabacteroides sp. FAFU027]|uniref:DUF4954 family protein n=1 Tax=Parabacteroides sp. FAFU027 TaxID=2922715 RepID=UPI001FAFAD47|nr:DUF4954 family protein [Parabacteroides sp. FAFU027]
MTLLRPLSSSEISQLKKQGCSATDWTSIKVRESFSAERIVNVQFSGKIELGNPEGEFTLAGGIPAPGGIYNATLHNCRIGNQTRIANTTIANYNIGNHCLIEQVGELVTDGVSSFGNCTEVNVLNETGGREVVIYDGLSVQTAYLQAFYRHRPALIKQLKLIIAKYTAQVTSTTGTIGDNCRIVRCGSLKNLCIGDSASIEGATKLVNGTVQSSAELPAHIGDGVMADHFIMAKGACMESGAMVSHAFVGQAVHLARQFSAVHSLFFSYSQGEHGEACAAFAGPFTVTHHKSTLLIGSYYSFMNAGSGTNQSNHLYRLGPIHQGILERGCKTGSDSYIMWPSRVGAFSMIVGKHTRHADTADLPFSYLVENKKETYLMPGATLGNVGTIRDAQKWKKRNTLSDEVRTDIINSNLFSPYTLGKILRGLEILKELQSKPSDLYLYNGVRIKGYSLGKGIAFYENAILKHLGDRLMKRLSDAPFSSMQEVKQILKPNSEEGLGEWIDIAGAIVPKAKAEALVADIESGKINTTEKLDSYWKELDAAYDVMSWNWLINLTEQHLGKNVAVWTRSDLTQLVNDSLDAIVKFDQQLLEDTRKEFSPEIQTGFGIDGNNKVKDADFEAVRGMFENHPMVNCIREHIDIKRQMAETLRIKLEEIGQS